VLTYLFVIVVFLKLQFYFVLKAKKGRIHIIKKMTTIAQENQSELKAHIPKSILFLIPQECVGRIIGSKGVVIQAIKEQYELTDMSIADNLDLAGNEALLADSLLPLNTNNNEIAAVGDQKCALVRMSSLSMEKLEEAKNMISKKAVLLFSLEILYFKRFFFFFLN
jgi:hypothetical protein